MEGGSVGAVYGVVLLFERAEVVAPSWVGLETNMKVR